MMVLTVFQRFACLQPSARVACHVPQGANCCNANAATVSDTVTAIGDKDAESVRKLVEGLWNAYDKNGDGALEASECDTIQARATVEAVPSPLIATCVVVGRHERSPTFVGRIKEEAH